MWNKGVSNGYLLSLVWFMRETWCDANTKVVQMSRNQEKTRFVSTKTCFHKEYTLAYQTMYVVCMANFSQKHFLRIVVQSHCWWYYLISEIAWKEIYSQKLQCIKINAWKILLNFCEIILKDKEKIRAQWIQVPTENVVARLCVGLSNIW